MIFPPMAIARYGVYLALAISVLSVWLGQRAGATLDFTLLRAVFIFVIFTALGFAAEAVFTIGFVPVIRTTPADPSAEETTDE